MTAKSNYKRTSRAVRQAQDAVAVIIDGKTEKLYINQVKDKYNPEVTRPWKITPDFPEKKKVKELFNKAKDLIESQAYTDVFLIVDLDEVLKDPSEWNSFKNYYNKYQKDANLKKYPKRDGWMEKLTVLINTPCLEYWYLLHFKNTTRFFKDYAELEPVLHKIPKLSGYKKTETYYEKIPKIYDRLAECLHVARSNAYDFDLEKASEQGCSEMFKLFDFIDKKGNRGNA